MMCVDVRQGKRPFLAYFLRDCSRLLLISLGEEGKVGLSGGNMIFKPGHQPCYCEKCLPLCTSFALPTECSSSNCQQGPWKVCLCSRAWDSISHATILPSPAKTSSIVARALCPVGSIRKRCKPPEARMTHTGASISHNNSGVPA